MQTLTHSLTSVLITDALLLTIIASFSGAGAPQIFKPQLKIIKNAKILKTNQKEGMYKQGYQINWAVLEPIMMLK